MKRPEFIARQGRRPSGLLGQIVARVMALETQGENDQTLDLLDLKADDNVLEIGFGHGTTLMHAAEVVTHGHVAGVDYSQVMFDIARKRNRKAVAADRMDLRLADSSSLPFDDARFDKAFSVHTVYFWQEPARHLSEVLRVLKPAGRFVLVYRSGDDAAATSGFPASIYRFPRVSEVEATFRACGFHSVTTRTRTLGSRRIHWTTGETPDASQLPRTIQSSKGEELCA